MNDAPNKQIADYLGLPKVSIEIVEITPEQRKKGEQGKVRAVEDTNSWVRGMVDVLIVYFSNVDGGYVNSGGTPQTADASSSAKLGALFSQNTGVLVGTGTTPVDRSDFVLDSQIATGNGAGQLAYTTLSVLTKSAAITGGYRVTLERSFNNNSGGIITINEAGILVITHQLGVGTTSAPLILRDIISPGHAVADGGAVIVRYLLDWLA